MRRFFSTHLKRSFSLFFTLGFFLNPAVLLAVGHREDQEIEISPGYTYTQQDSTVWYHMLPYYIYERKFHNTPYGSYYSGRMVPHVIEIKINPSAIHLQIHKETGHSQQPSTLFYETTINFLDHHASQPNEDLAIVLKDTLNRLGTQLPGSVIDHIRNKINELDNDFIFLYGSTVTNESRSKNEEESTETDQTEEKNPSHALNPG